MDSRHDFGETPLLEGAPSAPPARPRRDRRLRLLVWIAAAVAAGGLAASATVVGAGQAAIVSAFGNPRRVLVAPGLYWVFPAPVQTASIVDTRLQLTEGEALGAVTRDGTPLFVQAFAAWRVATEPGALLKFWRAAGGDASAPARQMRTLLAGAIADSVHNFGFADLFGMDQTKPHLPELEAALQKRLAAPLQTDFGITLVRVGIERMSLPEAALAAATADFQAKLTAASAARAAESRLQAAQIRAEAARDSRIATAETQTQVAEIAAAARKQAADIEARAYNADPDLYMMLRSLDTLANVVGPSTRLVLRTDAAPFNVLVQGPPTEPGVK